MVVLAGEADEVFGADTGSPGVAALALDDPVVDTDGLFAYTGVVGL